MHQTNDNINLTINTEAQDTSEFDFPGLTIGIAEYLEGPTGCTVFCFEGGAATAVDVRGGNVGRSGEYDFNHAICFAGGSLLGLEATIGCQRELFAKQEYAVGSDVGLPLVSGAIIYDYGVRDNTVFPDVALGRAALSGAKPGVFALGAQGAGRSATCGKGLLAPWVGESSGQGCAVGTYGDTRIAVFTVVNALGAIHDRNGMVVRGHLHSETGKRVGIRDAIDPDRFTAAGGTPGENTTLTLVVTNLQMASHTLTQLARQVHGSMSRSIQPFNTHADGDILFAVTTNTVTNSKLNSYVLNHLASELAWDAVLSSFGH